MSGRCCSTVERKAACLAVLLRLLQLIIMPFKPNLRFLLGGLNLGGLVAGSGRVGVDVRGLVGEWELSLSLSSSDRGENGFDTSNDAVANSELSKFGRPHFTQIHAKLPDLLRRSL